MKYIVIILAVMWLFSYVKFRKRYKMDRMMCEFTRRLYNEDSSNPMTAIEYGSALMQAQQYKSALEVFESVKRRVAMASTLYPFLDVNIVFCKKSLP